jgi:hypothetical protein
VRSVPLALPVAVAMAAARESCVLLAFGPVDVAAVAPSLCAAGFPSGHGPCVLRSAKAAFCWLCQWTWPWTWPQGGTPKMLDRDMFLCGCG